MASRLERLVSIDAYIRSGHYPSVQKLCEMFEVQPRTIYQDLRELREMFDLDIRYDRQRNGYYNATPSKQLPPLAMTYEEALLITLAIEMLASSFGPSFKGALTRALDMVSANDDDRFSWVRNMVPLETRANCEVKCSVLISVLQAAIKGQRATLLLAEGKEKEKIVAAPARVIYDGGHWHLICRSNGNGNGKRSHLQIAQPLESLNDGEFATPLCLVTDVEITPGDNDGN
jgi:predicted DNA-binding transcriptional regulator YafY